MDDRSDDVLGNFFTSSGRLHTLPAKRAKRLVVLDHIVQSFEPGETYTEKDVNKILAGFHDDYATLRRALVAPAGIAVLVGPDHEDAVKDAIVAGLDRFRSPDGSYRLQSQYHYLIARAR